MVSTGSTDGVGWVMEFNTLAAPGTTYAAGVTVTGSFPRVGDYELLTQIGEGGMGVVHLARASDGRRVAVKVLRPQVIGDQEARQRLAREVNSLRLVRSPRVAEILDADPFGPTPFVVTRYVPGLSLYDHIREEGLLEGTDLWHFARLLAEALVSVHSVGVLHRDVKPSNVLMEGRSPVLIDFGLARLSEDPRLTHTGWLLGTPGYLAPELLYGDEATPAADVHAWAATVVFAATGRSPYGKGPTMAVLDRVRLGDYDLTGVPANLRDLIAAGLSTEPTDRPTMSAILASLSGAAPAAEPFTMPITARPRSTAGAAAVAPTNPPTPATPPADPPTARLPATTVAHPVVAAQPVRSSGQRRLLLTGLTLLVAAMVGFAPYFGTFLVTVAMLLLRTASITGERHVLRRNIRGQARWYDGLQTSFATPLYLVIALFGTVALAAWGILAAVAAGAIAHVAGLTERPGLLVMGLVFAIAIWWGPGSTRLRATTRTLVWRASRGGWPTWTAAAFMILCAGVLAWTLLGRGPTWSPGLQAPWATGFLADVLAYL